MSGRWIMTVPVINTIHIRPETDQALQEKRNDFSAFSLGECGWLIYCGDSDDSDEDSEKFPDIAGVMQWARRNGSNGWLRVDSAGEVVEGLPKYEWQT